MVYIANHMIRHNGKLFKKGDEVKGLSPAEYDGLLKHNAIVKFGRNEDAKKPAAGKTAKE